MREKRGPGRPPFLLNAWVGLKSFSEKESLIFFVELLLIINEFSNQEKALVLVLHYGHLEARAESLQIVFLGQTGPIHAEFHSGCYVLQTRLT